jgi:hypothetical protein
MSLPIRLSRNWIVFATVKASAGLFTAKNAQNESTTHSFLAKFVSIISGAMQLVSIS